MKNIYLLLLSLFILNGNNLLSQELPEGVIKIATVEGITEYNLDNGLRVLMFPDQSKPTITVNITYLVGSRHEAYGETGMAHLLEHLVFKGTPNHPNIPQELTEHGARPNGTTWYDRTNYFETFRATDENLNWALDLESDRMVNSFIAKEDLDSEMTVVRNEYESGENSPAGVLMKRVMGTAFQWHNYGKSTIGAKSDLENVPIDRLQGFYRKYYQPDNAVLTVAGKIDEAKTLELINGYFGKIPRPERQLIPTYTKEPTQDGERLSILKRVGNVQAVSCLYHIAPGSHSDYPPIAVVEEILTSEPSGRLYKSLVETKMASSQWGFAPALKEAGFIYINADVRKENSLDDAKKVMLETLDNIAIDVPTEEEVERAKSRILKNWELSYNSSNRVGLRISEYIAQGDWRLFFLFRDRIEAVKTEDVVRVAKKYFKPSNRTVGLFIPDENPDRSIIPDAPKVISLVSNYKGREEISKGEEFDPSCDNIDQRTNIKETDSGIKYSFVSKENRGDAVVASIRLRYGTPETLLGKSTAANFAASMLNKGTSSSSRQEIQDKMDKLKAQIRISGSRNGVSARIQTINKNLPAAMDLLNEMLRQPVFAQEEFDKLKEERLAFLEEQLSEPNAKANNALSKILNPYSSDDIRYVKSMEEQIEAISSLTLEDVKQFYNDFYGASEASISIVGDFDEQQLEEKILTGYGDWKNAGEYQRINDPYKEVIAKDVIIEAPDKANAIFLAGLNLPVNDEHEDYAALIIGNYMLGGGFLNSRLATRIRQKDGLSYGVGSWFSGSSLDKSGSFGAYAIYAPENRDKVQNAFLEEINKVSMDGFSQEELDAARNGWLQAQTVRRSQDNGLVSKLNSNLFLDRNMQFDKATEEKIKNISLADVNKAMKKHIRADKMVMVKSGDFAKAFKNVKP